MSELFRMILSEGIFIMLCIFMGSIIIQKYIISFPNELIPLFNACVGAVSSVIWFTLHFPDIYLNVALLVGFLFGIAATGLHQLITKTYRYYLVRKYTKSRLLKRSKR